jgi:hypothetical protein
MKAIQIKESITEKETDSNRMKREREKGRKKKDVNGTSQLCACVGDGNGDICQSK